MLLIEHLVEDYSEWPNIALHRVGSSILSREVYLWGHCIGSSTTPALHLQLVSDAFGQSKVCDLDGSIADENILEFEVPVDEVSALKDVHAFQHLFEVFEDHWELVVAVIKFLPEIPLAVFENDETVIFMSEDGVDLYNERRRERF